MAEKWNEEQFGSRIVLVSWAKWSSSLKRAGSPVTNPYVEINLIWIGLDIPCQCESHVIKNVTVLHLMRKMHVQRTLGWKQNQNGESAMENEDEQDMQWSFMSNVT